MTHTPKPDMEVRPTHKATIAAVVKRADGTVEDLGVIYEGEATVAPGALTPSATHPAPEPAPPVPPAEPAGSDGPGSEAPDAPAKEPERPAEPTTTTESLGGPTRATPQPPESPA